MSKRNYKKQQYARKIIVAKIKVSYIPFLFGSNDIKISFLKKLHRPLAIGGGFFIKKKTTEAQKLQS